MRHFIFNSLRYIISIVLVHSLITFLNVQILNKLKIQSFVLTKNQYNRSGMIYILGNSHSECAINDSLLSKNYANIAISAEPLFYSVIKARRLLSDNCVIDTIVIEFSNNSLSTIKWAIDDNRLMHEYTKYFSSMNIDEHLFLFLNNFNKSIKTFFSLTPRDIFLSKKNVNGGYRSLIKNNIKSILKNKKLCNFTEVSKHLNENELYGFVNLLSLIKKHPKTYFVITRMPLHNSNNLNDKILYKKCIKQLQTQNNCRYIDFLNTNLNDDEYADPAHLNHKGANRFTRIFMDSLKITN